MRPPTAPNVRVALFCGGRGSAAVIREFLRRPNVDLALLINAYDDGLSTGALRTYIPGMLGPSDFRKNLSYLLELNSTAQYSLQRLLEYRFAADAAADALAALELFAAKGDAHLLPGTVIDALATVPRETVERLRGLLSAFVQYARENGGDFDFRDCSFGNLFFAGAYLKHGRDFNAATSYLAELFGSRARLVNVSRGEGVTLCALKADGEILREEASIVSDQSASPIVSLHFFDAPLSAEALAELAPLSVAEKRAWLEAHEHTVEPSREVQDVLDRADVIVYGSGTQHSSLFPSYKIVGDGVRRGPATARIFVSNLNEDYDIQGLTVDDLVAAALRYLGDADNAGRSITHVLYDPDSGGAKPIGIDRSGLRDGLLRGAHLIEGRFHNPVHPSVHNGHAAVSTILRIARGDASPRLPALELVVDLLRRGAATEQLISEFSEINWRDDFSSVTLRIAARDVQPSAPTDGLRIEPLALDGSGLLNEARVLDDWLRDGRGDYLAFLLGDGEYRLSDIPRAITLLRGAGFGAVYGTRTQSRRQFQSSLRSAYGEGTLFYRASWLGAFAISALFALRHRVLLSDPLTGFRVYSRVGLRRIATSLGTLRTAAPNPVAVPATLVREGVEIAEVPVAYRTFSGFTDPRWRFERGLRSLASLAFRR